MDVTTCTALVFDIDDERVTLIPSGFGGYIMVTEDPAYTLSVTYVSEDIIKRLGEAVQGALRT